MNTLLLALRNLLRNQRRSLATLLALAIGSAALLLFGGYAADIRDNMMSAYVRRGGHVQIQHRDFFLYGNGNPAAYSVREPARIIAALRADPSLARLMRVVTPTLQFGAIAGNYDAGASRTAIGIGLVPDDIGPMRQWNELQVRTPAPPFALQGAPDDAAIVGIGMARVLLLCEALKVVNCPKPGALEPPKGVALDADIAALAANEVSDAKSATKGRGDARIELLASQTRGSPNVIALKVVSAEEQGFKEQDEITVILPFAQAQQLLYGRGEGRATSIFVQLHHTADIPVAIQRLNEILPKIAPSQLLTAIDFRTLNPFYVQTMGLFDTIFGFISLLIGGIVLFTVSNTMNAAVVERTIEIGTLRAVGLRQGGIRRLFLAEGVVLGVAGAVLGLGIALLLSTLVNALEITWVPPGSSERLILTIRVWGETQMIIGTSVGLGLIAALSAWWPSYRAAKLKIVDALRHV